MKYAVILAGGVGSRFWPFSREIEPKQFMKVFGNKSLLQETIERALIFASAKNVLIVTNSMYFYEVRAQVLRYRIPDSNIILEPEGKNTAPAIGLAARLISRRDKDAVMLVLPADHYIKGLGYFKSTIESAIIQAKQGKLVTIGIRPSGPVTGYGYVRVVNRIGKGIGIDCFNVGRFIEKPNERDVKKYFRDKRYYWNSGIFVWKAGVFLTEINKSLPGLYKQLLLIKSLRDIPLVWPKIKPISVDYGVMEHSQNIALVPAKFFWTDLGSWDALAGITPKDKNKNILSRDCLDLGSSGLSVFSRENRLISTLGLKDLIIADTPDALLVCAKNRSQEVKDIVASLKLKRRKEHLTHLTERRPWGSFTVLKDAGGFKIKMIELSARKRLSLQRHEKRAEHWVVVSGTAKVTKGSIRSLVRENESIYIPKGVKHRLENPTTRPLKIVEVQTGNYLEEDDIERFEDDFKR